MSVGAAHLDTEEDDDTVAAAAAAAPDDASATPGVRPTVPGDSIAQRIATFTTRESARVVAAVTLCCGSTTEAADAVVDGAGRAWERLDRGQRIDNLAAWVTTVAMNQVRTRHRRHDLARRKGHLVVQLGSAPGPGDREADRVDLQRAMGRLGERQRQVVALHYGLGLTIGEVAAQLGIAEGTVKATLHQARAALAEQLGTDLGGASDD